MANSDILFSEDLNELRVEIVRLRSFLDCEFRVAECYRVRCEHLEKIIDSFIQKDYGKN